jgi:ketosteroid isomerase-like protein
MMTVQAIADDFATLCKNGKFDEAGAKYWSPNIVSIEAFGGPDGGDPVARGLAAVQAKGAWWYENHEVHSSSASSPNINGDQFIVRFAMDVTFKPTGQRIQMEEDALYTVKDGKIVEERFFYNQ